jgi:hypothetical protein
LSLWCSCIKKNVGHLCNFRKATGNFHPAPGNAQYSFQRGKTFALYSKEDMGSWMQFDLDKLKTKVERWFATNRKKLLDDPVFQWKRRLRLFDKQDLAVAAEIDCSFCKSKGWKCDRQLPSCGNCDRFAPVDLDLPWHMRYVSLQGRAQPRTGVGRLQSVIISCFHVPATCQLLGLGAL